MKKLFEQLVKFGIVGVIAFVIDYGLLVVLTELAGVNYLISATISFAGSVVFNYVASMRYVFARREDMSRHREFVIFVGLSVVGLLINDALMYLGTDIMGISYLVVKLFATVVVMAWNYITRKIFLENKQA